jgi:multiple antibiotic resistance protein
MPETSTSPPDLPLARSQRVQTRLMGLTLVVCCLLEAAVRAQEAGGVLGQRPASIGHIFTIFFMMLGPIKVIGPYAAMTRDADVRLARQLAFRAIFFATAGVLLSAVLGERFLDNYGIPVPVLTLTGGVILFLVALQTVLQQFSPPTSPNGPTPAPTLAMAMNPLAFPIIVTPYGVAAVIVVVSLSPDLASKLTVGAVAMAIMALNLVAMLLARHILRVLGVVLQIVGAVLGIIQVALGANLILASLKEVWVGG